MIALKDKISIHNDPWEAYKEVEKFGETKLSNIEFTTTTLCNMRCAHCAVGYTLQLKDPDTIDMTTILKRLDEVEHLSTLSITGGEPMFSKKSIKETVTPILEYAKSRGIYTQMNSNLTINYDRYEPLIDLIDVMHISHNWGTIDEFAEVGFHVMDKKPPIKARYKLYEQIIENARRLSEAGMFVSAETMLNKSTLPYLEKIHKEIVNDMKCARHEVHPMYPSDFASDLNVLTIEETKTAIRQLLSFRDEDTWMLFGTLPILPCSMNADDLSFLDDVHSAKNVTVRNDPDGRSRLNVNVFTGDVIVTDFGDETGTIENIIDTPLQDVYDKWKQSALNQTINCHCPKVKCLGPNLLVKNMYYPDVDFKANEKRMHEQ
ncbi:radical SAM/CxCxxxxC motif protein YfkAB [Macrococcus caseolyticus]|uniref:radical SAM/CxCxxxxC motif protein YfkAB n=1 Tax=Macrococcoides caseolyticum TaxID=69966 RepID=UPI0011A3C194|nr:radical SAM/CxCxxxxC motif protein YfkAB [Macrococcus caseolyticus]MDJ1089794.1 radical SAM/CxCxxxxC motif protein YfkAB [Macrococcus caseolyticus]MDJ1091919.1 radical SAM/CxCxxxxC motif protein YfkAB [Macrococcus caseolyticus]MDJ1154086.1 radical SAM/CxCxxxxC motif protein YfkAB [Macrococcus caseolyticus]MDJ1155377.1 radical SAM/CxCxxxxC motif protein YfkAB [Macrococcus caseolyticus]QYA39681.1 radical SAM/CxCxxxxC motif protein YfkAB [Macrococcus caseolyticus]